MSLRLDTSHCPVCGVAWSVADRETLRAEGYRVDVCGKCEDMLTP